MAENKKISELPVASSLTGAELFEVVQGGVNKQAALDLVRETIDADFVQTIVDTTLSTITLDFSSAERGYFSGSASFDTARTVELTNEERGTQFDFIFEVSDEDVPIDFGPDTRSTSAMFVDGVFTPQDVGLYKVHGVRRYGTDIWILDFKGVYSVGDAPPTPTDQWILSTGIWNNSEFWDNDAIWRDLP